MNFTFSLKFYTCLFDGSSCSHEFFSRNSEGVTQEIYQNLDDLTLNDPIKNKVSGELHRMERLQLDKK